MYLQSVCMWTNNIHVPYTLQEAEEELLHKNLSQLSSDQLHIICVKHTNIYWIHNDILYEFGATLAKMRNLRLPSILFSQKYIWCIAALIAVSK